MRPANRASLLSRCAAALVALVAITIASACSGDAGSSIVAREFLGKDSTFGIEYRARVQVDRDRGIVRELRLVSSATTAGRQVSATGHAPEIEVWGSSGTFQAPIRSTCRIFDDENWVCQNVNTGLVDARGNFLVVGTLEMRRDTLREAELSGVPIVFRRHLRFFGRSP